MKDDDCPDPFPTNVARDQSTEYLFNSWYDFDDSRVGPISVDRLQKYFGKNKESAYILMYRKTSLNKNNHTIRDQISPTTLLDKIKTEESALIKWTTNFESYKRQLRINICHVDQGFDFIEDQIIPGAPHVSLTLSFKETLRNLRDKVRQAMNLKETDNFILVQYEALPNGTVQMASIITDANNWMEDFFMVKELYLYHNSNYFLLPINHPKYSSFATRITLANVAYLNKD